MIERAAFILAVVLGFAVLGQMYIIEVMRTDIRILESRVQAVEWLKDD